MPMKVSELRPLLLSAGIFRRSSRRFLECSWMSCHGDCVVDEYCTCLTHSHRRFIPNACIVSECSEGYQVSSAIACISLYQIGAGPNKALLNVSGEMPHRRGDIAIHYCNTLCEKR